MLRGEEPITERWSGMVTPKMMAQRGAAKRKLYNSSLLDSRLWCTIQDGRTGRLNQEPSNQILRALSVRYRMSVDHKMTAGTLDISEARKQFTKLDERLRTERVIWVTRHNKKAFAIVDTDLLETVLETIEILSDPDGFLMLQQSLQDIQAGRLHDHEAVKQELME